MKKLSTAAPCPGRFLFIGFLACLLQYSSSGQQIKFGNSYVNLSKKTSGGTVQPGDTLEIRTNYYFASGYNGNNIYYVRYVDNVPTNTNYIDDSLRLITNEGLTYKKYTNASDADEGTFVASPAPGEYNVRINIGVGSTSPASNDPTNATGGGNLRPNTHRPRAGSGLLVTTAFKVVVTGAVGDTITLGAGHLYYKKANVAGSVDTIVNAIQYKILISNNDPICAGAVGKNFVAEAGGTFDSGFAQNRSYGPAFSIPGYNYLLLSPSTAIGDGNYTIVNNLSPLRSTSVNSRKRPNCTAAPAVPALDSCKNRMFNGYWDIIGDHTGSGNAAGNPPKDSTNPAAGGYMLVVNADYATSEAYRQTISGLCPNTSYEFSLWVRNVCTNCGIDSTGTSTYNPGVFPNLTFAIDDLDRYSSGQVDTLGWLKKGFLFKTGSAQTSITISIRNNASGGGGNDWAIDDIALVTCNPDLDMQPTGNANVCIGNAVDMSTLVSSFFDNYIYWAWDISTDNGSTWSSTGQSGTGSAVLVGGNYEYTAAYPTFIADSSSHLNQYRFKVGSSVANLNDPNCWFIASTIITVWVNNCTEVLKASLLSFNGKLDEGNAQLKWITDNEQANTLYTLERSTDRQHFVPLAQFMAQAPLGFGSVYTYTDPLPAGQVYYRIKISEDQKTKYSRIIVLNRNAEFAIRSLVNPFNQAIGFDLVTASSGIVSIYLNDAYGRLFLKQNRQVIAGTNKMQLNGLGNLPAGTYTLRIQQDSHIINRQIVKTKQ